MDDPEKEGKTDEVAEFAQKMENVNRGRRFSRKFMSTMLAYSAFTNVGGLRDGGGSSFSISEAELERRCKDPKVQEEAMRRWKAQPHKLSAKEKARRKAEAQGKPFVEKKKKKRRK